nr:MAG TPA: hypothetical protein [Caudoviricetes sp.]
MRVFFISYCIAFILAFDKAIVLPTFSEKKSLSLSANLARPLKIFPL